jgi:hypothetical protein
LNVALSQLEIFVSEIEKLRPDYRGIDVRIIAFAWNGTWVNVASRFVLSPGLARRPYLHHKSVSRISELCLISDALPIEKLSELMEIFSKGELSIQDKTIIYKRRLNQKWDSPYAPFFNCLSPSMNADWNSWDSFAYSLRVSESGSMMELLQMDGVRRIESKLASLPTPFAGMQDLTTDFVGPVWLPNVVGWCFLEILAPIGAKIVPPIELERNRAILRFEVAQGYRLSKVSLGYVMS